MLHLKFEFYFILFLDLTQIQQALRALPSDHKERMHFPNESKYCVLFLQYQKVDFSDILSFLFIFLHLSSYVSQ